MGVAAAGGRRRRAVPGRRGGYILPPDRPGLGVDLDEAACAAARFEPRLLPEILAPDGAVRDW